MKKLYVNIDIGTPRKTTQLPLEFYSNDFYIGNDALKEMPKDRFIDLKYYDTNSSTLENTDTDEYYSINGDIFEFGMYKSDNFYFNNQTYKLDFYLAEKFREVNTGGIGLQLYPSNDIYDSTPTIQKTFLGKLKNNKLIKGYYWSIFYNSNDNKKEEGTLLLGCLPHEFNDSLGSYEKECFNLDNKKSVNFAIPSEFKENKIDMDAVYAYEGSNTEKLIEDFPNGYNDYRRIELDYSSGGVKVPLSLKKYYHRIFEEHISAGNCFNDSFHKNNFNYYYCKKNNAVLSKIKKIFPKIIFLSRDLIYNFTLDYDDLFVEENGYVFCLLYFKTTTDRIWVLGKPFLRKYFFTFNYDKKDIDFYINSCKKAEEKPKKTYISLPVLIIIVIITILVVLTACFLIFKFCLYDKLFRKKRATELDDHDFDYTSKEDNKLGI